MESLIKCSSVADIVETEAVEEGKDDDVHFEYYLKAAKEGDAKVQFKIGVFYDKGKYVAQDFTKAVEWYTKVAQQGHAKAQFKLGVCYDKGIGIANDELKAIEWYKKAAEQGHEKAVAQGHEKAQKNW